MASFAVAHAARLAVHLLADAVANIAFNVLGVGVFEVARRVHAAEYELSVLVCQLAH